MNKIILIKYLLFALLLIPLAIISGALDGLKNLIITLKNDIEDENN
jgi:hypothetical protein